MTSYHCAVNVFITLGSASCNKSVNSVISLHFVPLQFNVINHTSCQTHFNAFLSLCNGVFSLPRKMEWQKYENS